VKGVSTLSMPVPVPTPGEPLQDGRVIALHPEQEEARITPLVGMIVFLGSWAMMFAALFFTFALYRVRQPVWPPDALPELPLWRPLFNTLVIGASSALLQYGYRSLRAGAPGRFLWALLGTIALGLVFLGLQVHVWAGVWAQGLQPSSGPYAGHFYLLTVFHALHVIVGLGLMSWLVPQVRGAATPRRAVRAHLTTLFWHFVGAVWALVFLLVYVL
jgi:heme/copper-type cytochrome/quinol oxidase subunit 3